MSRLRLAAVFGDHMVLCRRKEIRIFGEAAEGSAVRAQLNGATAETTAREGHFLLLLPPMEAGGPYELTVSDGETTIGLSDVLVGEVYLAGGQSNMELELQNADDGKAQAKATNNPLLRFYNTPKQPWWDARAEQAERDACWKLALPDACLQMSAVAFHFAVCMQAELGIPVGIVDCYWGGTTAACWIDEPTLRELSQGQAILQEYAELVGEKTEAQYDAEYERFETELNAWNDAVARLKDEKPGIAWEDIVAVCGECPWNPPAGCKSAYRPAGLVETMLRRVAPYTLTGILYYQGESDDPHPERYRALMVALIRLWRKMFMDEELPFSFVQLPMYIAKGAQDDRHWAMLRLAQEQAYREVRGTALTVLLDCGEWNNIHPTDKRTVGQRLYQQTTAFIHGTNAQCHSPRAIAKRTIGDALILTTDAPVLCREGQPKWLEIAGEDGCFVEAKVGIDGCEMRLTAKQVPHPTQARYAWVNYAIVNLFGDNGLPLAPFWLE